MESSTVSNAGCKMIHLRTVIVVSLCSILIVHNASASPAAATTKRQKVTPTPPSSSPVIHEKTPHFSPSGLRNVTGDIPRPDFDAEVRSEESEPIICNNATLKLKKKKQKKNTALKRALKEAARKGMDAMVELYDTLEPSMKRKGEILAPDEPGAKLSMFSAPHFPDDQSARAAYAALYAAKKLKESYNVDYMGLGRQAQTKLSLRRTALEGLCPPRDLPRCLPAARRYRTHDGTCNNERNPRWGSAQMPFHRFLQPDYSDGVEDIRRAEDGGTLPSARFVSLVVHGSRADEAPVTMMLAQWGQFIDHDLTATAQPRSINGSVPRCCGATDVHPACLTIRVPQDDPWLAPLNVRCLEFLRSAPAQRRDCVLSWREQINQATSYLDASTVYASNPKSADGNRLFRDGLLLFGRGPAREDVCLRGALANHCVRPGDQRSGEQPGLMAMHTVWVAEHNRIAIELGLLNPHWSDEKLYQEARRIIGAMVQHITFREFLPLVLGREVCRLFDLQLETSGYYNGYDPKVNPTLANSFGAAAFRFGHSLVQGSLMRGDRNHRFMFNNVTLHEEFGRGDMGGPGSLHRLVRGLLMQRAQKRDEFISAELTNHLFQSNSFPFGLDLAAINVQRGRDHGLPSYTSWRVPCGLSSINSWRDLVNIFGPESTARIRQAYQSVNDIDLFVGGLAERPVIGGLVGPTFACILAQQFSNLRKGDRFWYENGGSEASFTPAQLSSIRHVTLSQVLCRQLNGGGTLQPHAFLPPDMTGNERQFCGEQSLIPLDLIPWTERDPLNKQHDLTHIRPTIIALKPQLIPNTADNSGTKKKKKRKKKPNLAAKEGAVANGIETKLDFTEGDESLLLTKKRNSTAQTTKLPPITNKLDTVKPTDDKKTTKREKLTTKPNDKLDFEETRTTLSTQTTKRQTDKEESRSIVSKPESKNFWRYKDPNTIHISISWNNWNGLQKPTSKPAVPNLHDKLSSDEDEIHFLTGTGGSGQITFAPLPTNPPPAPFFNSPFSYNPQLQSPPMTNDYGPMTWTWNYEDAPVVMNPPDYDIRNTIKLKPRPAAATPTPYRPTYVHSTTTPQTHVYHVSKRPTYYYSPYKHPFAKDHSLTVKTPFNSFVIDQTIEAKSSLDSIISPDEHDSPSVTSEDLSTTPTTIETFSTSDSSTTETFMSPSSTTSSTTTLSTTLSDANLKTDKTDSTTTDSLLDYDEDYDFSTIFPPGLTDDDDDNRRPTGDEDEDENLTQFDKDGYLRPEYMNLELLTLDPDDKLNKDFKTLKLDDALLNNTEPRRPALDIESDLNLTNNGQSAEKGESRRETISFVPLVIVNGPERPDDWWIREGPEKAPLPRMPDIVPDSDTSLELPKPMLLF